VRLEPQLRQVLEKYPEDVKLVIKHFPLQSHAFAGQAASAALAAAQQGKFWEFHQKLFENQKDLNDAKVQEMAQGMNLDMERFNADMKSPAIRSLIQRDLKNGYDIEIQGTPSIFVNGKLVRRPDYQGILEMVESELKRKKTS
jgi:protein-disulfide isomerase